MPNERSNLRSKESRSEAKPSASSNLTELNEVRPIDIEEAKRALKDVLSAEVESETVPSDVLSFRMKRR
jgi:hypothetical protein